MTDSTYAPRRPISGRIRTRAVTNAYTGDLLGFRFTEFGARRLIAKRYPRVGRLDWAPRTGLWTRGVPMTSGFIVGLATSALGRVLL